MYKKIIKYVLVSLVLILSIRSMDIFAQESTPVTYANELEVATPIHEVFPDPNLAQKITTLLNKDNANEVITQSELDTITTLEIYWESITTLQGLNYLSNLQTLFLVGAYIEDISYLGPLSNLTNLALDFNRIEDITPLENLTRLEILGISNNLIIDISAFSHLVNLKSLDINFNRIEDLSPLSTETYQNLESLNFAVNKITDISALDNDRFPALLSLNIAGNSVTDLMPLENITTLKALDFASNKVESIEVLSSLPNLIQIWGDYNQITNISSLNGFNDIHVASFEDQLITSNAMDFVSSVSVTNLISGLDGKKITPSTISNNGYSNTNTITWDNLDFSTMEVNYTFSESLAPLGVTYGTFSGTVIQPFNPVQVSPIIYELSGGVNNVNNPSEYIEGEGVSYLYPATREGHIFMGWVNGDIQPIDSISSTAVGPQYVWATWRTNTAPVLEVKENIDWEINQPGFNPKNYILVISDGEDLGLGIEDVVISPGPYPTDKIGTFTVYYSLTDSDGNTTHAQMLVNVVDTTAPILTVEHEEITLYTNTSEYSTLTQDKLLERVGVNVSDNSLETIQVTTNYDELIPLVPGKEPGKKYTLVISAKDTAGNESTKEVIITVIDNTPPKLTTKNVSYTKGNVVTKAQFLKESIVALSDDYSSIENITTTTDFESVVLFHKVGVYNVTVTAVDEVGNSVTNIVEVTIEETKSPSKPTDNNSNTDKPKTTNPKTEEILPNTGKDISNTLELSILLISLGMTIIFLKRKIFN